MPDGLRDRALASSTVPKYAYMAAILLLVIGGLNWGVVAVTKKDVVAPLFGKYAWIVYSLVALAAVYVGFNRDTYLPFLGESVFPCSLLKEQTPENADVELRIPVQGPGKKVLYWAAEPETEHLKTLNDWRTAYLGFFNAGVAIVGSDNMVTIKVRKPQPYTVPMKGRLDAHVHFRVCNENGMMGPVQTMGLPSFQEHFKNPEDDENEDNEKKHMGIIPVPDVHEEFFASAVF